MNGIDFDPQKNYYDILGVSADASADDIKKAYRKAAMQHHPDRGGDAEKFKEINEANSVIGNQQKRQQYDAFRSGGYGNFGGGQFGGFSGGGTTFDFGSFQGGQVQIDDVFDIFGSFFGGAQSNRPRKGQSLMMQLNISFEQSYHGTSTTISYDRATSYTNGQAQSETKKLTIDVPAGIGSGTTLKFAQMGHAGMHGGPFGDLLIKVMVKQHDSFMRERYDLLYEHEISIYEAVLGSSVTVKHLDGELQVKIPKGLQVGEVIKVPNKGFAKGSWKSRGDFVVIPKIHIPKKITRKQEKLWKELQEMG